MPGGADGYPEKLKRLRENAVAESFTKAARCDADIARTAFACMEDREVTFRGGNVRKRRCPQEAGGLLA